MARVKKAQAPPASKITPQTNPDFKTAGTPNTPDFKKPVKTKKGRNKKQPPQPPANKQGA